MRWELRGGNYVQATAEALAGGGPGDFDAIVMNPPYRKVNGDAGERRALERIGLPISNLYTAFLALAARQLVPDGVLAAITPRSFANGRYSAPFRRFFFELVGVERLHLFESRADAFADSGVLQENVIFSVRRGMNPARVQVSFSRGVEDEPRALEVPSEEIVRSDDPDLFLRIPSDEDDAEIAGAMTALPSSLGDLGIAVSTGRVVEFRAREHLRITPEPGTAPLLRPNHFKQDGIRWPAADSRGKPNALAAAATSEKLLLPNGIYVLVKRLTAKEARRRVRAAVCDPSMAPGPRIAFENHLHVFHRDNEGLPPDLAQGLAVFLNSSLVDATFASQRPHPDQCHRSTPSPLSTPMPWVTSVRRYCVTGLPARRSWTTWSIGLSGGSARRPLSRHKARSRRRRERIGGRATDRRGTAGADALRFIARDQRTLGACARRGRGEPRSG